MDRTVSGASYRFVTLGAISMRVKWDKASSHGHHTVDEWFVSQGRRQVGVQENADSGGAASKVLAGRQCR
jgi:hypothetical protein